MVVSKRGSKSYEFHNGDDRMRKKKLLLRNMHNENECKKRDKYFRSFIQTKEKKGKIVLVNKLSLLLVGALVRFLAFIIPIKLVQLF